MLTVECFHFATTFSHNFILQIEKEGQANVDIQEILLEMRRYRMGLIQTSEQLRFSYIAIVEGIKRLDPTYVSLLTYQGESNVLSLATTFQ